MMFNSDMSSAAPGLWASLKRSLPPEACAALQQVYACAVAHGAAAEGKVAREAGASFNPRPARYAHLLLQDAKPEHLLLAAAFLYGTEIANEQHEFCAAAYQLAQDAARFAELESAAVNADTQRLALAHWIDELRHLHMMEIEAEERESIIDRAERFASRLDLDPNTSPLVKILHAALTRLRA